MATSPPGLIADGDDDGEAQGPQPQLHEAAARCLRSLLVFSGDVLRCVTRPPPLVDLGAVTNLPSLVDLGHVTNLPSLVHLGAVTRPPPVIHLGAVTRPPSLVDLGRVTRRRASCTRGASPVRRHSSTSGKSPGRRYYEMSHPLPPMVQEEEPEVLPVLPGFKAEDARPRRDKGKEVHLPKVSRFQEHDLRVGNQPSKRWRTSGPVLPRARPALVFGGNCKKLHFRRKSTRFKGSR